MEKKLTHYERAQLAEKEVPEIDGVHAADIYIDWGWTHKGFGQLRVYINKTDGKIHIDDEYIRRESVRKILHAFADYVADNGVLASE